MVVSVVAVCEIFSVKEWCMLTLKTGLVRSRSLEMAPLDRSHASSYSLSIVTVYRLRDLATYW